MSSSPDAHPAARPWHDPHWRLRWLAPGVALAVALTVLVRAHLHFFFPWAGPVSNDEGYISALALRMLHGNWLPYVDGVSQRGPLLYWLAAIAMKIGGQFSWLPIRWLGLLTGVGAVLLSFFVAAEFATPLAGGVAALVVTYFLSYEVNPWDGIGYNGEILAMQFALGSMLVVGRAMRPAAASAGGPRRDRVLFAAGVLGASAGLCKQMTLTHMGPSLLWLALGTADDERPPARRARDLAAFLLGAAAPYAAVLSVYAATGHLRTFVYYYQRYGRDIFMAPLTRDYMRDKVREQIDRYFLGGAAVTMVAMVALSRALRDFWADGGGRVARLRRHPRGFYLVAQLACAMTGASFTFRFFPHYFVQVYPVAALVAGYAASGLGYDPADRRDRAAVAGAFTVVLGAALLLAIASTALTRNVRLRRETDRWYQDPRADPIVRYVLERSQPSEKIFVWGFRAETYVSSARLPASRFVYTVYPSGVVPWFQSTREEEERRVVPGSRRQLLDDLEQNRPILVIDAGRSMNGRYMYNYPELRTYLDRNYCFMRYVDGEPVYRRRQNGDCPPADY
ncbi:MAG: hypothetical protein U0324_45955 [Polyangiales bacterium]